MEKSMTDMTVSITALTEWPQQIVWSFNCLRLPASLQRNVLSLQCDSAWNFRQGFFFFVWDDHPLLQILPVQTGKRRWRIITIILVGVRMRKLWSVHPVWKTPSRFPNASQNWARGINILSIILTVSVNISTAPRQKLAAIGVYLPPLWTSQIISMNALQVQVRGRCIQFKRKGKESGRPRSFYYFWIDILYYYFVMKTVWNFTQQTFFYSRACERTRWVKGWDRCGC